MGSSDGSPVLQVRKSTIGLAVLLVISGAAAAQTATDGEALIRDSVITAERTHSNVRIDGNYPANYVPPSEVKLSKDDTARLRQIIVRAFRRNRQEEEEARKEGTVTAGVPGCVSYDYALHFDQSGRRYDATLHLCAGWIQSRGPIGNVVLDDDERDQLAKVLKFDGPCPLRPCQATK